MQINVIVLANDELNRKLSEMDSNFNEDQEINALFFISVWAKQWENVTYDMITKKQILISLHIPTFDV